MNKKPIIVFVLFLGLLFSLLFSNINPVFAWKCGGCQANEDDCYPNSLGAGESWCNSDDDGAELAVCQESSQNSNCVCSKGGGITCPNAAYVCGGNSPPTCSCQNVSCTPSSPTKFRRRAVQSGESVSCSSSTDCNPSRSPCTVYRNSIPSCTISPVKVEMTRADQPKVLTITASDADWGDSVSVRSVKVVNKAGDLNSCVTVKSLGGGSLINAILRPGTDDNTAITKATEFMIDAREAHGIYVAGKKGESICEGKVIVEIIDVGDSTGDAPTVPYRKCSIDIKVTNEAPKLSDVSLFDKDPAESLRDIGAAKNGDLIDGRAQLFVGSTLLSATKLRAAKCKESLSLADPIKCPVGAEFSEGIGQKRNPLQLEFTVSDANGINDIMQAGVWIQRVAQNKDTVVLPPVNLASKIRNSFQVLYSEKEDIQVVSTIRRWNFLSRACLGTNCGPQNIQSSSKQIFSALAFTAGLGPRIGKNESNGNVKTGTTKWVSQKAWQKVGFPDCLNSTGGCLIANVPTAARTEIKHLNVVKTATTAFTDYDWSIAADSSHLICFKSDSAVPTVVEVGTPIVCPADCAACAKKEGVDTVANNPNALTFKFGIYFNDKDGGQGMLEGKYSVFISALDKVGVPLNNVVGKGDDGWLKFTQSGDVCPAATCPKGKEFVLNYDPIAPVVDGNIVWKNTNGNIAATIKFSDKTGGSGIAGVTQQFMAYQDILNGDPDEGGRRWAPDGNSNLINGKDQLQMLPTTAKSIVLNGTGLSGGEDIITGLCAFDNAGNMGCGRNGFQYVFLAPWLKTSYGDIYSGKGNSTIPFSQSIPSEDVIAKISDDTKDVYKPFIEQIFTAGTGLLMTGGNNGTGITGGHIDKFGQYQFGFKSNYRFEGNSLYNVFGHEPFIVGNEYERIRAAANLNCELMNTAASGSCQSNGTFTPASLGLAKYNILYYSTSGTVSENLICSKSNIVFVTAALTISGQVTKPATGVNNGCLFVLSSTGSLTIEDMPSNTRKYATTPPKATDIGIPTVDRFDAAVVGDNGASFTVSNGKKAGIKTTDRLEISGWIFMMDSNPSFKRNLATGDNKHFPAEWILYDASLLDTFRPIIGSVKTVDVTCGTSSHVLCKTAK